jgi:metallo-beta-lactamase class B
MKRILAVTLFALILIGTQCQTAAAQEGSKPVPPFQIFDNLYYVGLDSVCAYILKTSGGLILIDTLYVEFADYIPKAMQQLGLNPKDIKYIIVTHAHTDHSGGAIALQDLSGARVAMAEGDWQMNSLGKYVSSGGPTRVFPPIRRDMVIKDGDTLKLGDTTVKFYITPGHTPGVTSLEFPVFDHGKEYKAFEFGGIGLNTVNGARAARQFIDSVKRVMAVPGVQVSITNHPEAAQILERAKKLPSRKPTDPHPFVDPEGFRTFLQTTLAAGEKKLQAELAANRP